MTTSKAHTEADLDNIFAYHPPDDVAKANHEAIRKGARAFAQVIEDHAPDGADKSAAIRLLRESMFTANAAIALKGKLFTTR